MKHKSTSTKGNQSCHCGRNESYLRKTKNGKKRGFILSFFLTNLKSNFPNSATSFPAFQIILSSSPQYKFYWVKFRQELYCLKSIITVWQNGFWKSCKMSQNLDWLMWNFTCLWKKVYYEIITENSILWKVKCCEETKQNAAILKDITQITCDCKKIQQ